MLRSISGLPVAHRGGWRCHLLPWENWRKNRIGGGGRRMEDKGKEKLKDSLGELSRQ